jgi:hypothetical protein
MLKYLSSLFTLVILGLFCFLAVIFSSPAHAGQCGIAPIPPIGMYYLCICDNMGNNCHWVLVSK